MKTPTQMTNKKYLTFRKGTTILAHDNLISFLHEKDTRILHRMFNDHEWQLIRGLNKIPYESYSEEDKRILDHLESVGILSKLEDTQNSHEFLERDNLQLLHMLVMITNRCNMDCSYCYTEANMHIDKRELPFKQWNEFFDIANLGGRFISQNISFTGGEPTIYPNFAEVLRAVDGKYKVEVTSNGLEIKKDILDTLVKCESLKYFNISIDSKNLKEDEIMRGKETYHPRIKNLKLLYTNKVPICIGEVISHINLSSLEETTRFFLSEFPGIKIKYIPLTKIGKAIQIDEELFLTEKDAKKYVNSVLKMKEEFGDMILTDPSSFEENQEVDHWSGRCLHMKYDSERTLHKEYNSSEVSERCNAAYGVVSLSPDGRMRPCLRADSFYSIMLKHIERDILMPKIVGLDINKISGLPFWKIIKKQAKNFNPAEICALEKILIGG
ncbi:MAG TPA: radical SAM protein [Candidatus Nanoarchaeia archaeon]|nr:radical SAM protein [Candidatus Nanoarchaeia archaeon]